MSKNYLDTKKAQSSQKAKAHLHKAHESLNCHAIQRTRTPNRSLIPLRWIPLASALQLFTISVSLPQYSARNSHFYSLGVVLRLTDHFQNPSPRLARLWKLQYSDRRPWRHAGPSLPSFVLPVVLSSPPHGRHRLLRSIALRRLDLSSLVSRSMLVPQRRWRKLLPLLRLPPRSPVALGGRLRTNSLGQVRSARFLR